MVGVQKIVGLPWFLHKSIRDVPCATPQAKWIKFGLSHGSLKVQIHDIL